MTRVTIVALAVLASSATAAGAEEPRTPKAGESSAFTLGLVQKALQAGLSQAEVAERLGAPNILTRDGEGREAWVYDRLSSEVEVSSRGFGVGGVGSGAGSTFAGLLGLTAGKRSNKARSSQRAVTVVVRFSAAGKVESFTWHDSRF